MRGPHRNYLHTFRKKTGLLQREVAWIAGYTSCKRISNLELGLALPNARECAVFARLFHADFHELWPGIAGETERDLTNHVRALRADYSETRSGSFREQQRCETVRRHLDSVLAGKTSEA